MNREKEIEMRKEEREAKEHLSMRPVFKAELPHPVSPCVICIVSEELVLVDQTKISSSKAQCNSMRYHGQVELIFPPEMFC